MSVNRNTKLITARMKMKERALIALVIVIATLTGINVWVARRHLFHVHLIVLQEHEDLMVPTAPLVTHSPAVNTSLVTPTTAIDVAKNASPCKILVTQKLFDVHYEILESIALRFPLPWDSFDACRSNNTRIVVDFMLAFNWSKKPNEKMEAWGWKTYFERYLEGTIKRRPVDGRLLQFGSVVFVNPTDSVDFSSYTFEIDATGDSNLKNGIKWLQREPQRNYCILHGKNDDVVPSDLQDRICYLNPQHEPHCWFIPSDFPKFPLPPPPTTVQNISVCIASSKDPSRLVDALQKLQPSNVEVVIHGRNAQIPSAFRDANLSQYIKIPFGTKYFYNFQKSMSACHILIPLLEPKMTAYFLKGGGKGRLSGSMAQAIGNHIPSVLEKSVVQIYGKYMTAPYYEYDDANFTNAFQKAIRSYSEHVVSESVQRA